MKVKKVIVEGLEEFFSELKELVHKEGKFEYISVGSIEELNKILTPQRKKLIDTIRKEKPASIRELANLLGRDYKNVYEDVILLEKLGFVKLERKGKKLTPVVDYDEIEIKVKVGV